MDSGDVYLRVFGAHQQSRCGRGRYDIPWRECGRNPLAQPSERSMTPNLIGSGPNHRAPAAAAVGALILFAAVGCGDPPPAKEDPAVTLAWFDSLGYPDLATCKFVQGATRSWRRSGNDPPRN